MLREKRGFSSQKEFAEELTRRLGRIGSKKTYTAAAISHIERGVNIPEFDDWPVFSEVLGLKDYRELLPPLPALKR